MKPLTVHEKQKIARRACRRLGSEITLILTAGWALVMVVAFWTGKEIMLPLAEFFEIHYMGAWLALSAGIAVVWAFLHALVSRPIIERAKQDEISLRKEHADRKRETVQAKIDDMKSGF